MICCVCRERFAPYRADHFTYDDGNPFITPVPDDEKYLAEWSKLYDMDIVMSCSNCSL